MTIKKDPEEIISLEDLISAMERGIVRLEYFIDHYRAEHVSPIDFLGLIKTMHQHLLITKKMRDDNA